MRKIALFVVLASVLSAAKKHEALTYELTGEITGFLRHYNSEAHVSANGTTVDAYCDATDTSVSCYDSPGLTYIKLADGSLNPWPPIQPLGFVDVSNFCLHEKYSCNPLSELYSTSAHDENTVPIKFKYRLAVVKFMGMSDSVFCVARTDAEGIRKHKEACYRR
ncbi:MAG: hypothetical protein WBQ08_09510 [Candidatus Sulfotelmatobacter sp.]